MKALVTDIFSAIVPAPFGAIGIRSAGDVLHELTYLPPQYKTKAATDKLSKKVAQQVAAYLKNPDYVFDLIGTTRALDGRQTESWGKFRATWSYHPDSGLQLLIVVQA